MEPVRDARHMLANAEFKGRGAGEVSETKKSHFEAGAAKKSKFERDKEAAERKQAEQDAEMARAYQDFAQFFDVDDGCRSTGSNSGSRFAGGNSRGFVRQGDAADRYNPLQQHSDATPRPAPAAAAVMMQESEPVASTSHNKKKRDMDRFLEELKRDQRDREERLARTADQSREFRPALTGSFEVSDATTTNVHVGNLPATVTERDLGLYFARYGPVGSVKIMWPRLDGPPIPAAKRSLGGFVAFMRRPDAERAFKDADGKVWQGEPLRLSWGKAVPIPSRSLYEVDESDLHPSAQRKRRRHPSRSRSRSPDPHRRSSHTPSDSSHHRHEARRRSRSPSARSRSGRRDDRAWPELEEDADERLIQSVAQRIKDYGREYEEIVREKERHNRKFDFLRYDKLPSFHWFRMLLDPKYIPPTVMQHETFDDQGDGEAYSTDSAEEEERQEVRKGLLGRRAKRRLECLLRGLTSTREKIARGMAFALDHSDAAPLVVDLIIASLLVDSTPVPRKIARLHLISDILHNSSASIPNAWTYRSTLESRLPVVFDHLGDIFRSFPGRIKAEQFKMQVDQVLDVWDRDWIVFEPGVIEDLRTRLVGGHQRSSRSESAQAGQREQEEAVGHERRSEEEQNHENEEKKGAFKKGAFKAASFVSAPIDHSEPEHELDATGATAGHDDTDMADDVDGQPIDATGVEGDVDVDGAPVDLDDVDGAPVDLDDVDLDDVDGESIATAPQDDDDVDGDPIVIEGEGEDEPTKGGNESDGDMFEKQ